MNLGMLNPIANTGMETTAAYEMVAPQMEFITDSQSESLFYTASAIIMLASICWMTWIYILVFTHTQHGTYSIFSNSLDYTIYHERDWWNNKPWNKYPKGVYCTKNPDWQQFMVFRLSKLNTRPIPNA